MKLYESKNYARERLINTIIMVDGEAVIIDDIRGETVLYTNLLTSLKASSTYDRLDLSPVPLGYINTFGNPISLAAYAMRIPKRRDWRQGLRAENCGVLSEMGLNFRDINLIDLARTIKGVYPSISEAMRMLMGEARSVAFSRTFAISKDLKIQYKGVYYVGVLKPTLTGEEIDIYPEFEWVQDELERNMK